LPRFPFFKRSSRPSRAPQRYLDVQERPAIVTGSRTADPVALKVDLACRLGSAVAVVGWCSRPVRFGLSAGGEPLEVNALSVARPDVERHFSLGPGTRPGFVLVARAAEGEVQLEWGDEGLPAGSAPLRLDAAETVPFSDAALATARALLALRETPDTAAWRDLVRRIPLAPGVPEQAQGMLDVAEHRADGRLVVVGWVAHDPDAVVWLEDQFGAVHLLAASSRVDRPDVVATLPERLREHAGLAGFETSLPSGQFEYELSLKALTPEGLFTLGPPILTPPPPEAIRMHVERSEVDESSLLSVSGWAVSRSPIIAIQLFLGEERIATTAAEHARPDIQAAFPSYPNAARSGFFTVVRIPPALRDQVESLTIEVVARDARTYRASAPPQLIQAKQHLSAATTARGASESKPAPPAAVDPPPVRVFFHSDLVALETTGSLKVAGWVVATSKVVSLHVDIEGQARGTARFGKPRPDVGRAFPDFPDAQKSGFDFAADLPGSFQGENTIHLIVGLADGTAHTFAVTTVAEEPSPARESADGDVESIRLAVDGMQIESGHARRVVGGSFHLVGWAIARSGVASVEIFLDGASLGRAYHGIRREDVGRAFPAFPNSLTAGFALSVPARRLETGRSRFRVAVTDTKGETAELSFTVDIEKLDNQQGLQALRLKMSHAEVTTTLNVIGARGPVPTCDFALRLARDDDAYRSLLATIASVAAQAYPEWRIWLMPVDPSHDVAACRASLAAALPELSERIGSIADYVPPSTAYVVGVLEAGDLLAVDALLAYVLSSGGDDAGDFIYGDDRRLDGSSGEVCAFFKPDWSPDLLLSQNYVGRAWVATSALLARMGLELPTLAGSSDYDIVLRATTASHAVRHVRSLVLDMGNRLETPVEERRVLALHLERTGVQATVEAGGGPLLHRVRRVVGAPGRVSVVIPSIGAKAHVVRCLESVRQRTGETDVEIVLVDNLREGALTDETRHWKSWFREHADVVVPVDEPFNWSRLNNLGAERASGEYLLFLNDDIEVLSDDWLTVLVSEAARPEVGVVGAQLLYPDGKVQHAGMFMSRTEPGNFRHAFRFSDGGDPAYFGVALSQRNVLCVTGACMMVRRAVFDELGGFDEVHSVVNNDVDFCLRAHRSGRLVVFTPHVRMTHYELASRATLQDEYDRSAFMAVWNDLFLAGDPFYHPRLSGDVDDYALDEETFREVYAGYPLGAKERVRRILAVKLDHIGDLVTSLPAIRRLKSLFPHARITALVGRSCVGLASTESAIDEVIPFEFFDARSGLGRKVLTADDYAALEQELVARHFDLAIDLRKLGDTRHILQHSGAAILAGYDHARHYPWLDIALEWERDELQTDKRNHIANDLLNLVDAVGNAFVDDRRTMQPKAPLPELSTDLLAEFPGLFAQDYVVVHPASGTPLRQWPAEHFARLIDLLVEQDGVQVALVGGPDERSIADEVLAQVKQTGAVFDLVGRSRLSEVPRILQGAVLFVGNNSGPSHIAAGVGTPTVSVHSALVSSEEWGPLGPNAVALRRDMTCGPCYIVDVAQCHRKMECLTSLSPFAVHGVCRRFLSLRASKHRSLPTYQATPSSSV